MALTAVGNRCAERREGVMARGTECSAKVEEVEKWKKWKK
jgi:hypothetical protein